MDDEKKEMSRGAQTAWIVGTLLFLAFMGLGIALSKDDPRYPGCEVGFMGTEDQECQAEIARRHLMRGY